MDDVPFDSVELVFWLVVELSGRLDELIEAKLVGCEESVGRLLVLLD